MSDHAIKSSVPSDPQSGSLSRDTDNKALPKASGATRRYAVYGLGALIVLLTLAYIDGGEEPLHPIVQSVSLPAQSEGQS